MEIREHTIDFTPSGADFEMSMRRKPKSQEEFEHRGVLSGARR